MVSTVLLSTKGPSLQVLLMPYVSEAAIEWILLYLLLCKDGAQGIAGPLKSSFFVLNFPLSSFPYLPPSAPLRSLQ